MDNNTLLSDASSPERHTHFLHRLIENAFSWALQDCNYLSPVYLDRLIAETHAGLTPERAAVWNATRPSPATAPMPATVSEAMVERAARAMVESWITNDPRSFGFSSTVDYTAKRVSELVDTMWPRLKNEARAALETVLAAGGRE